MSKKLIAVASAAALALSALVAMPSVATPGVAGVGPFQVEVLGNETTNQVVRTGGTASLPLQVYVPSGDVLRTSGYAPTADALPTGSSTALRVNIQTPGATDAITITATGGVKVVTDTQFAAATTTSATGVQSLTVAAAAGDATVYAYTTSTTAGTLVVSAAGSSRTIHIQGLSNVATNAYKLSFSGSASSAIGGTISVTGTVKDMFDNLLTPAASNLTVTTMGGSLTGGAVTTLTDFTVNATTKVVTFTVPSSTTASQVAVSVAAVNPPIAYTAFPGRSVTSFFLTNAVDLAAQVTALTAQVAALTADYNALAAKWNKRVASKKAPKKAVATK
jgi:hypothetical protein